MRNIVTLLFAFLTTTACIAQAPTAAFSAAQTAGCAPVVISFGDASTGNPTAWQWNFGNGVTSTLQNPSTTYFTPGTYTVTLTVSNGSGNNTLTRTGYITVYAKPSVAFAAGDSNGCAPFAVRFTDLSSPAPGTANTTWLWDFGNGTNSSLQNPQTTYGTPGNYTVSLKVTSDKGCFTTLSKTAYVRITGGLQLDFSSTGTNRCRAPFPVSFTNASTGPGTLSYYWTFGDGGTSALQNPSHTYSAPGSYAVAMAVTSNNGCTDTVRKTSFITIQNISTAFTAPDSVCVLSPASFTNTSSPAPQSTAWNFGDATASSAVSPLKTYSTPGTYTVRLVNTYSYCSDSASRSIKVLAKPVAGFTAANVVQCKPPLTTTFSNGSSNAVSWQWDFGDGGTATQQNPTHTYTTYGNFTVRLIVTNASGCADTLVRPSEVRIQKPVISFPSLPQSGCVPYTTTFTANVATPDNVTSYLWDFGNGSTSALASPTYTYPLQGTYNVSLTVTTGTGCTEQLVLNSAINTGRVPVVDFSASPNPACTFGAIQFTGIVNEGDTWKWTFGDSTASTLQKPVHTYTDTGSYTVSFTATNNGCPATVTKPAFVKTKPPISNFGYTNDCQNRKLFFFKDSSVGPTSWQWDFGDGGTSTQQNPSHTFPAFGTYLVTLRVMNDTCSHTKVVTLNIFDEAPTFTADKQVACKTASIGFTAQSSNLSNIVSYNWNFSNGSTSTLQNPQAVYTTSGTYTVTLTTVDVYGCKDTAVQTNFIRINGPTAVFVVPVGSGCLGFTASFTDLSSGDGVNPIQSWQWFFGDGTSQTFTTPAGPQHVYNAAPGYYTPKLVVTDAAGCKDSLAYGGLIGATTLKANFTVSDSLSCLGSTVNFTNTSLSFTQTFESEWRFGDGDTSTQASPSHTYATTGSYPVTLKIYNAFGCADSITINPAVRIQKTVAAFTVSDSLGGCTPFEVRFTNASQFYQSSLWQLGNGSSTVTHPSQVYNTPGTYNIKLVATGRGGCTDSAVKTVRIFDAAATTFSYSPFNGCKPLQLTGSINSPADLSFTWDFGDGTTQTTTALNTVHTYSVFGNYVPKLLLSDSGNCLVPLIGIDTVKIVGVTAKFGWNKRLLCDSAAVVFSDSTAFNDPVLSYNWSFGDGSTATTPSPVHNYTAPGLYNVTLAVQTQRGCKDTVSLNGLIKVVESPSVHIDGNSVICQNDFVQYTGVFNRTDTSAVRWAWTFPNGSSSAAQHPALQQFTSPGTFAVQAVAVNSSGCTDTAKQSLVVNPLPAVTVASPLTAPLGTPVLLPAIYTNSIVDYRWSPAAGLSCTDCPQPFASPRFTTLYKVTVTDDNGCKAAGKVQVIVLCQGSLVFVPNTFSPNGDGSNDVFYVRGKGLDRVKSLRIFNRWGETVFEKQNFAANDAAAGWNGTHRGKKAAADVYVYQVEVFCENGEVIRFDGSVTLLQ